MSSSIFWAFNRILQGNIYWVEEGLVALGKKPKMAGTLTSSTLMSKTFYKYDAKNR